MSCDLHRLVSGGRGGEIRLWRLGPAARRLARGLAAAAEDEEEADTGPGEAEECGEATGHGCIMLTCIPGGGGRGHYNRGISNNVAR